MTYFPQGSELRSCTSSSEPTPRKHIDFEDIKEKAKSAMIPGGLGIPKDQPKGPAYRYSEDKILADLKAYIDSTYSEHYHTDQSDQENITCLEAWDAMGDLGPTLRNTAVKYLWRYGRKDGPNKKDLMKTLHYVMFLLHFDHYRGNDESKST